MRDDQTKKLIQGVVVGILGLISGTSVGTIAFIFGIYPEVFFKFSGRLIFGIFLGLILMRSLYPLVLPFYFIEIYSLLFGMVLTFLIFDILKYFKKLSLKKNLKFSLGVLFSTGFVFLAKKIHPNYFFEGMIQSFQFILPGGTYDAYHARHFDVLEGNSIIFKALGVVLGGFLITRILHSFYQKQKNVFYLVMLGMVAGTLPQIWPWREAAELANLDGRIQVVSETIFLPSISEPQTWWCFGLMSVSALIIGMMRVKTN